MDLEQKVMELEKRVAELEEKAAAATTATELKLDGNKIANQLSQAIENGINQAYEARQQRLTLNQKESELEGLEEKRKWMKEVGIKEFDRPMKYYYGAAWIFSEEYMRETSLEELKARLEDVKKDKPFG